MIIDPNDDRDVINDIIQEPDYVAGDECKCFWAELVVVLICVSMVAIVAAFVVTTIL